MTQMEDWLGIILGILFILGPALLDKKSRKKKSGKMRQPHQPPYVEAPEEMEAPQSEIRPVYVPVSSDEPVLGSEEVVLQKEQAVQQPVRHTLDAVPEKKEAVPAPEAKAPAGRKRRINGRDMIIYSEILKPKF